MKKKKTAAVIMTGFLTWGLLINVQVTAAPSIGQLNSREDAEIIVADETDGTNTSQVLADEGVYVDLADSAEYMDRDEQGNLIPTNLSKAIDRAKATDTETKENGKSIVENIPTVEEIFTELNPDIKNVCKQEYGIELEKMKQLTYMLDLKYISTGSRVAAGKEVPTEDYAVILDNGTVKARIRGGEILRRDDSETIFIMHVNEETEKITVQKMEEYDPETGTYTIVFPGIGPYMVVQIQ